MEGRVGGGVFFKAKTGNEMLRRLGGSEMGIRDRHNVTQCHCMV